MINTQSILRPWGALLLLAVILTASAEAPPSKFAVAAQQLQTLGITTVALQQTGGVSASFPAQVIVAPDKEHVISAPWPGVVQQLLVQPGQVVKQGAALLRLAGEDFSQEQLQLLQAGSQFSLAEQAAQRDQQLFSEGIIPERRVQETKAALMQSRAALDRAKAELRLSGMSTAAIEHVLASGRPLDSVTLSAPSAGIVTDIELKLGQRVEAGTALLHVAQIDSLWLEIQVPASAAAQWKPGNAVAIAGRAVTARLLGGAATVAASSQTVELRAVVETGAEKLRPGEWVVAELPTPLATNGTAWSLPLAAVVYDNGRSYVFVRTRDGFEARPVTVSARAGQQVQVQGDLKAGEPIAVTGVIALKGAWLNGKESQ